MVTAPQVPTYTELGDAAWETWDWVPYAERYLQIKTIPGEMVPFRANHLQRVCRRDRVEGQHLRVVRVKPRRTGSTVTEALSALVYALSIPNFNAAIGAEDIPNAQKIIINDILKPTINSLPREVLAEIADIQVVMREVRIRHLRSLGESHIIVNGLRDESFGLGYDIHQLVVTEGATIPERGWHSFAQALGAVPDWGLVTVEGTADGAGNEFHSLFISGKYHQQFFPWYEREDAVMPADAPILNAPKYAHLRGALTLTPEQQELGKAHNISADRWRFYLQKSIELGDMVHGQYPTTASEAFLSASRVQFPVRILEAQYNEAPPPLGAFDGELRAKLVEMGWRADLPDEADGLRLWRLPLVGRRYTIGVDTGEGEETSDLTVAQVIDDHTGEQAGVLRGRYRPDQMAAMVDRLGRYYNRAFIVPEKTGIGAAVCQALQHNHSYPALFRHDPDDAVGYNMTRDRKWELFQATSRALEAYNLRLYDRQTIRQMLSFRAGKGGRLEAPEGMNDDCVMALMLACTRRADTRAVLGRRRQDDNPWRGWQTTGPALASGGPRLWGL